MTDGARRSPPREFSVYHQDVGVLLDREPPAMAATLKFKMILLGDFGVGKTTLFHRIRTGRFLEEPHNLGQNIYVCEKTLPLKHGRSQPLAQICLWDTAGEERFLSLSRCYYRGADAVLLVYSLPRPLSFDSLSHWLCVARQYCAEAEVFVLGNKSDLESHVPEEKVERFVAEHAISGRYKVSAKTGENVERYLQDILERLLLQKEFQHSGLQTSLPEVGYYSHCAC